MSTANKASDLGAGFLFHWILIISNLSKNKSAWLDVPAMLDTEAPESSVKQKEKGGMDNSENKISSIHSSATVDDALEGYYQQVVTLLSLKTD